MKEQEVVEVLGRLEANPGAMSEGAVTIGLGFHVMLVQPGCPLGDRTFESLEGRIDVVGRVDGLAHVVKQGGQQELLVVGPLVAGQLEDLKAMVEGITLGMVLRALLDWTLTVQTQVLVGT